MLALAFRSREPIAPNIAAFRSDLLKRARALVGGADADDLVQSTLERALQHQDRFQQGTNMAAWLRRIMSNLMVDDWRRNKQHYTAELEEYPAPTQEVSPPWRELTLEDLRAGIQALPPRMREVFDFYSAGISYAEISSRLGIKPSTVGTRLRRARLRLRRLLTRTIEASLSQAWSASQADFFR